MTNREACGWLSVAVLSAVAGCNRDVLVGRELPSTTCGFISVITGAVNPCGRIYGIAYSPDGRFVAIGAESPAPNVHVWRLSDGARVGDFNGVGSTAYDVAFSRDSKLLAVGGVNDGGVVNDSGNGTALLYDVASGALVRTLPTQDGFYTSSVAFSNDGVWVATAGAVGNIEVWRVSDGTRVTAIPYPTTVHNIHFAPTGQQLISGGVDKVATVWNLPAGTAAYTLSPIADEMADAEFSPDGAQIASTGPNDVVQIWDVATRTVVQTLTHHQDYVSQTVWVDQNTLLTDDWSGIVTVWARPNPGGQFTIVTSGQRGAQGLGMAVSPGGGTAAVEAGNSAGSGFEFIPVH